MVKSLSVDKIMDRCETDRSFKDDLIEAMLPEATDNQIEHECARRGIDLCGSDCGGIDDDEPSREWIDDNIRADLAAGRIPDALYGLERRLTEIDPHFAQTVSRYYGKPLP